MKAFNRRLLLCGLTAAVLAQAAPSALGGDNQPPAFNTRYTLLSSLNLALGSLSINAAALRVANGAALQAAFRDGKGRPVFDDIPGGAYVEHFTASTDSGNGVGLQMVNGFEGVSYQQTKLIQFDNTSPAVMLGAYAYNASKRWVGFTVGYGATPTTSNTNAIGILFGQNAGCFTHQVQFYRYAAADGVARPPYKGFQTVGSASEFSNEWGTVLVDSALTTIFSYTGTIGTGDAARNFYMGGGSASDRRTITGQIIVIQTGQQGTIDQLNSEWVTGLNLNCIDNHIGLDVRSWHSEGITLTGYQPFLLNVSASTVDIHSWQNYDPTLNVTGGNGPATQIKTYASSKLRIFKYDLYISSTGNGSITARGYHVNPDTSVTGAEPVIVIYDGTCRGYTPSASVGMDMDPSLLSATYGEIMEWEEYRYGRTYSTVKAGKHYYFATQTTLTSYGCCSQSKFYTGSGSAAQGLVLSRYMRPSGVGAATSRTDGDLVTYYNRSTVAQTVSTDDSMPVTFSVPTGSFKTFEFKASTASWSAT